MGGTLPPFDILVIDADRDAAERVRLLLSQEGHHAVGVHDARQALRLLRKGTFHLVIVDVLMAGATGPSLIDEIRRADSDVAIIAVAAEPSVDTASVAISHGVSAYSRKPLAIADFRRAVRTVVRRERMRLDREAELQRTIGDAIRKLRRERALTLTHLAKRTGLSTSLLSQVERGETSPSVVSLMRIANALGVSMKDLFGGL